MTTTHNLITRVLESARSNGIDQKQLAKRAGVRPETISRAKKRATMDVSTVGDLARAAGLELTLVPMAQEPQPTTPRSPLADPKWGLAWSNAAISDQALVRNALIKGAFSAILEAEIFHGPEFVRSQWQAICKTGEGISPKGRAYVERMLNNIEAGLADAQA